MYLEIINIIVVYLLVAATGSFLSKFWCTIIIDGEIFGFFGRWLLKLEKNPNKLFSSLANPLGLCVYCNTVWATIATAIAFSFQIEINPIYCIFISVPLAAQITLLINE